ncbi:fibronectin type III domain-containing protein [Actinokineospora spheciospongiae]|uniref:fibronectin type III domain-containing protein n=1 Tax=Actinokineospora spheciospongiae TaxID=909613 RepID=UPI000D89BEFC|nr:fibronectin type III domain-containing protein [Actinokineospora spheciospongiae]PWW63448.1 hypothetical protein DFQ13_104440 [Actinokineospora spheciospongiae]
MRGRAAVALATATAVGAGIMVSIGSANAADPGPADVGAAEAAEVRQDCQESLYGAFPITAKATLRLPARWPVGEPTPATGIAVTASIPGSVTAALRATGATSVGGWVDFSVSYLGRSVPLTVPVDRALPAGADSFEVMASVPFPPTSTQYVNTAYYELSDTTIRLTGREPGGGEVPPLATACRNHPDQVVGLATVQFFTPEPLPPSFVDCGFPNGTQPLSLSLTPTVDPRVVAGGPPTTLSLFGEATLAEQTQRALFDSGVRVAKGSVRLPVTYSFAGAPVSTNTYDLPVEFTVHELGQPLRELVWTTVDPVLSDAPGEGTWRRGPVSVDLALFDAAGNRVGALAGACADRPDQDTGLGSTTFVAATDGVIQTCGESPYPQPQDFPPSLEAHRAVVTARATLPTRFPLGQNTPAAPATVRMDLDAAVGDWLRGIGAATVSSTSDLVAPRSFTGEVKRRDSYRTTIGPIPVPATGGLVLDGAFALNFSPVGHVGTMTWDAQSVFYDLVPYRADGSVAAPGRLVFQCHPLPGNRTEFGRVEIVDAVRPPYDIAASDITSSSVRLSWTRPEGIVGFEVYNGTTPVASTTDTSAVVSGLTPATEHTFAIRSKNAAGDLSADNGITFRTLPADAAPTALRFTATGTAKLKPGTLPLSAAVSGTLIPASGELSVDLTANATTANLRYLGIIPVTASVRLTPQGPATGTLTTGEATVATNASLTIPELQVFGIPLRQPTTCASAPSRLELTGPFTPTTASLSGAYTVAPVAGCGALSSWMTQSLSGPGRIELELR